MMPDAPLRISDQAILGDPMFGFDAREDLDRTPPSPALEDSRVTFLLRRVEALEARVAQLEAQTLLARWQAALAWLRSLWPWR